MKQEYRDRRVQMGIFVLCISLLLTALDQFIKYFVMQNLKPVGTVTVIRGLLSFSYMENTGAAFGLFQGKVWLLSAVTVLAFCMIVFLLFTYRSHTALSYISSALVLAGGIGNFIDRIAYGFVVDFIHVHFFNYIFNFADCCITVGAFLFVFHVLLTACREKQENKAAKEETAAEETEEKEENAHE